MAITVGEATISTTHQVDSKVILTALERSNIILIVPLSIARGLAEASVVPVVAGCIFGGVIYTILYKRCIQITNKRKNEKSN